MQTAWAEAVGEAVAAEATPVSERDGVVTVACRSATWAQELDLLGDRDPLSEWPLGALPERPRLRGLRFNAAADPAR